jgi:hypothetical protein
MKKTVLALSILFAACSSNSEDLAPEEEIFNGDMVYTMEYCPDHQNSFYYHPVTAKERQRVNEYVNKIGEYCVYIKFTTFDNKKIEGYYAGEARGDD